MPVSHQHKCVFIHIPKTGGTSIETALNIMRPWQLEDVETMFGLIQTPSFLALNLGTPFLQHLTFTELLKVDSSYSTLDYFSFAWVRNPFERVISSFKNKDPNMVEKAKTEGLYLEQMSFSDFVDVIPSFEHAHLRPQVDYIYDQDGEPQVDFIGRFENFTEDFQRLCECLKISCPLPHKNSSPHKGYEVLYNKATTAKVCEIYEADFRKLGYKM